MKSQSFHWLQLAGGFFGRGCSWSCESSWAYAVFSMRVCLWGARDDCADGADDLVNLKLFCKSLSFYITACAVLYIPVYHSGNESLKPVCDGFFTTCQINDS